MNEGEMRVLLCELAASLFVRGYSVGSAGNISARLADGYLMTPTNSSLGRLDPQRLSKLDADFRHVGGDKPSKEVFMHRAFYQAREDAGAVVHDPGHRGRLPARCRYKQSDTQADTIFRHARWALYAGCSVLPAG